MGDISILAELSLQALKVNLAVSTKVLSTAKLCNFFFFSAKVKSLSCLFIIMTPYFCIKCYFAQRHACISNAVLLAKLGFIDAFY